MSSSDEHFATAINCIDGRSVRAVMEYFEQHHSIPFVDMVTKPGLDGHLCICSSDRVDKIKKEVDISIHKHGSRIIALVGHDDCAANPVSKTEHIQCVEKGMTIISKWNFEILEFIQLFGLWVEKRNGKWVAESVFEDKIIGSKN